MPAYELMYIVRPELDEEAVQQAIDRVNQLVESNGGQIRRVTPWGKRRLAFTVKDQREGYYVVADVELDRTRVQEIERVLKISDTVFRHMLVRQPEGKS